MSCILRLHPRHLGISWRSDVDGTAVGGHFSLARTQRHNDLAKPEGAPQRIWQCAACAECNVYIIIEGSLEVKLPTIWTDEKQSREEAERRGKSKKKED